MITLKQSSPWYVRMLCALGIAVCMPAALEAAKKIIVVTMQSCPPCKKLKGQIAELQRRAATLGATVEAYDREDSRVRYLNLSGSFPMIVVEIEGNRRKVIHGFSSMDKLWNEIAPHLR